MKALNDLGAAMNAVAGKIEQIEAEAQKVALRRGIADMMGALYTDLMRPIIKEHPELDPDHVPESGQGGPVPS